MWYLTQRCITDKMNALQGALLATALIILACNATYGEEIINGKKPKKNTLQYMASLQLNGQHKCGGFLIHPSYVLTAAHCNNMFEQGNITVVLGTQNLKGGNLRKYAVQKTNIHIPETFMEKQNLLNGSDIMLLKLPKKVKLGKDVTTVKIPSKEKSLKPGSKCLVAGWGKTENEKTVNELLMTEVSTISFQECQKEWSKHTQHKVTLPKNVLCAGGYKTKSGACQGDSGGPLVCSGLAVGIVSFNLNGNCNYPNVPNVYTQISKYLPWINKVIKGGA